MTVSDLIDLLKKFDGDLPVWLTYETVFKRCTPEDVGIWDINAGTWASPREELAVVFDAEKF